MSVLQVRAQVLALVLVSSSVPVHAIVMPSSCLSPYSSAPCTLSLCSLDASLSASYTTTITIMAASTSYNFLYPNGVGLCFDYDSYDNCLHTHSWIFCVCVVGKRAQVKLQASFSCVISRSKIRAGFKFLEVWVRHLPVVGRTDAMIILHQTRFSVCWGCWLVIRRGHLGLGPITYVKIAEQGMLLRDPH